MILKHRDTEVLRFDWVKPFGVTNVELNHSAERFLPLAYRDRVIGKDDRTLAYETESWLPDGFFEKPEAGGFEPFAEYYAAQVAEAMKLPHVDYGLAQLKYRLCSTCPLFTSDKVGYLAARGVAKKEEVLDDPRFADIFFFDAIIFNTDRHTGNFGFLVDNDINEISGIAPIFDNGYSLFSRAISDPGKRGDEFHDLRLFLDHNRPKLYDDWLGFPTGVTDEMIDRIKGLEKFEFRPHHEFVMPNNRLEVSQYFLQNRIARIVKYGAKADKYLKIRASSVRINPLISDKMLKKAKEAEDLRKELKATLKSFPRVKTDRLAVLFKTTTRTIARHIKSLQEAGELKRVGSRKTGYWQVIEKETVQ